VDNDPVVLLHARSRLVCDPAGAAGYVEADLRDTGRVLAEAARTLDFSQPVAVLLLLILHLIPDSDDPCGIVGRLMAATAPGSFLVLTHVAADIEAEAMAEMARCLNRLLAQKGTTRTKAEITRFFQGLVLAGPGVVPPQRWRPGGPVPRAKVPAWSGVARKPQPVSGPAGSR
jgi:hypothetical protein